MKNKNKKTKISIIGTTSPVYDKSIKEKTYDLINILIEKGGKPFWPLKDIIKND